MRQASRLRRFVATSAVVGVLASAAVWAQPPRELRGGDTTPPVAADTPRDDVLREGPKYEKYAEGLYARRVYRTVHPTAGYVVEVWGLLIGPGKKTEGVTLPGVATLLVRSGRAAVAIGDSRHTLGLGSSLLLSAGQKVSIVNLDADRPVSIRAVIITIRGL